MSLALPEPLRRPLDDYPTPDWVIDAVLPHVPGGGQVLEPSCGAGAILRRLRAWGVELSHLRGIELDEGRATIARQDGFTVAHADALYADWGQADLIITNPPYRFAEAFVRRALSLRRPGGTVAMLLRLGFLESIERADFNRSHPADVLVLPRRPSFVNGRSDACAYGWFVWGVGRGGRWSILDVPATRLVSEQQLPLISDNAEPTGEP